jgi:hypothetical protein
MLIAQICCGGAANRKINTQHFRGFQNPKGLGDKSPLDRECELEHQLLNQHILFTLILLLSKMVA